VPTARLEEPRSPGRRLLAIGLLAIAIGLLAMVQWIYFQRGLIPGDAFVYLAAGERLNAGHELYSLMPGDRPVDINPPYWRVPLVSPPPIAVVFRPLALLGDAGAYVWWGLQLACFATALVMLGRRVPIHLALAMLVLLIPTVYEIGVGNLNAMLLLGLILAWRWTVHGPESAAGALGAVMTAVKLTPAMVVWWQLWLRRWRAVAAAIVTGLVVLGISVLGAGFDTHLEYLRILTNGQSIGLSPLSLGGMATYVGLPPELARWLSSGAIVVGLVAVALLRNRPAWAFAAAVLTMIYGSPSVSINWYVLLYALLAPFAWPAPRDRY
jgi:hypothetical protein